MSIPEKFVGVELFLVERKTVEGTTMYAGQCAGLPKVAFTADEAIKCITQEEARSLGVLFSLVDKNFTDWYVTGHMWAK